LPHEPQFDESVMKLAQPEFLQQVCPEVQSELVPSHRQPCAVHDSVPAGVLEHVLPHVPQLAAAVGSTQPSVGVPSLAVPVEQHSPFVAAQSVPVEPHTHLPAAQVSPAAQTFPQPPQLATSVASVLQPPLAPVQHVSPALHEPDEPQPQ
jgi:hypothetical protein